jgi:uncharacterized membrane protein
MAMTYSETRPSIPRVSLKAIRDMEEHRAPQSDINVGQVERWASGIGGGFLVLQGLRRADFGGLALAILGGALAYRGISGHCQAYEALDINTAGKHRSDAEESIYHGQLVKHTQTINRTPSEIYDFLQIPANHARFNERVESVSRSDDGVWHWAFKGPFNSIWKFDSSRINEEPGRLIAWKSLPGGDIENAGSIRLAPVWDGRGTEVTLEVSYQPPAGTVGVAIAKMLGHDPNAQVREDLRRLKNLLETGEIPTVLGQPAGHGRA